MRRFFLIFFGLILCFVAAVAGYVTYRLYLILPDNTAPSQVEYPQAALDLLKLTSKPRVNMPEWMNYSSLAARRLFGRLSPERYDRLHRGWHENFALASVWVELRWSEKEKLNTILDESLYGYGTLYELKGLEQASQGFFGVSASELTIEEIAVLVVNMKARSNYEPWCNPQELEKGVIDLLYRYKQAFPGAQFDAENKFSRLKPLPIECKV